MMSLAKYHYTIRAVENNFSGQANQPHTYVYGEPLG